MSNNFADQWHDLVDSWHNATSHWSVGAEKHPDYLALIELGKTNPSEAITLALLEMARHKNHWAGYVHLMMKEMNVPIPEKPESVKPGKINDIHNWLLDVGRQNGFIKPVNELEITFGHLLDKLYHKTWCWTPEYNAEWHKQYGDGKVRGKKEIVKTEEFKEIISFGPKLKYVINKLIKRKDEHRQYWMQLILDAINN